MTEKLSDNVYVPVKSSPAHISCTTNGPDPVNPGTFANANVLVAEAEEVLMMNTCTPFEEVPE